MPHRVPDTFFANNSFKFAGRRNGLGALILNVAIAAIVTLVVSQIWPARKVPG